MNYNSKNDRDSSLKSPTATRTAGYAPEEYKSDVGFNLDDDQPLAVERKTAERPERIEILLNAKESMQKEKSWEKGLKIIEKSMNELGFKRYGVFLVNPLRKKLEFHSGKGVNLSKGTSIRLRDSEHVGVKCVLEKRTIRVKRCPKEKDIAGSDCVWVPIIIQNQPFGALVAGTKECRGSVTDEDVEDLEMLAGMCAAFIDRRSIVVEPVTEERSQTTPRYWLDSMEAYIVLEETPGKSVEIFSDLVTHGIPGCVVSRVHPEKLRKKYNLVKTPMLWLSRAGVELSVSPDDLPKLEYIIEDFTRKSTESVILLDGVEYLMTQTSFEDVLQYVQELKDIMVINNSRLIISLYRDALSQREYSVFVREAALL